MVWSEPRVVRDGVKHINGVLGVIMRNLWSEPFKAIIIEQLTLRVTN